MKNNLFLSKINKILPPPDIENLQIVSEPFPDGSRRRKYLIVAIVGAVLNDYFCLSAPPPKIVKKVPKWRIKLLFIIIFVQQ